MPKPIFLIFCFLLGSFISLGQNQHGLGVAYRNGVLIAHRPIMNHLSQRKIQSVELNYFRDLTDSSSWASHYSWATVGFSGLYSSTGNSEVLGQAASAFLYGELGFFDFKGIKLGSRVGFGLGFVTKKFNQQNNPKNVAIGSHFNATVLLGLIAKWKLGNGDLVLTADMTHFSNGGWAVPNLGLNKAMLGLGYRLNLGSQLPSLDSLKVKTLNNYQFTIYSSVSGKEIFPTGGKRYLNIEFSPTLEKRLGPKVGLESSIDVIYRGSLKSYLPEFKKNTIDLMQASVNGGVVFYFNRFSTLVSLGAYIRDVYQPNARLYQKVGLRYQLSKQFYGQIVLKSVYGRADYLSWGIGYRFKSRES
ncbi:MAG: acyloxyacyl hydrolase [Bacteroidetes bacterium]|nr:acyloxyacyl hydrolase [Bacteroidota bacterium]